MSEPPATEVSEQDSPRSPRPPEGGGWEPWVAANAPDAEVWVNELRREIAIVENGAERRIAASDAASFALEVAELEQYYDASPKASNARDAAAMLTRPLPPRRAEVADGAAGMIGVLLFVGMCVMAVVVGRQPVRGTPLEVLWRTPYADRDTGPASSVGKAPWSEWAEQRGSLQLRDALQAGVPTEWLYKRDIARASTPEFIGTSRCPDDARLQYDTSIEFDYEAARSAFVLARTATDAASGQFPAGTRIRVEPPVGCRVPGAWAGLCIPIELVRGEYSVATCYRIDSGTQQ